jgi:hypothetical protein
MESKDIQKILLSVFYSIGLYDLKDIAIALSMSESNASRTIRGITGKTQKKAECLEHVFNTIFKINPACLAWFSDELKRAMEYYYDLDDSKQKELAEKFSFTEKLAKESGSRKEAIERLEEQLQECLSLLPKREREKAKNVIYALEVLKGD